MNRPAWAVWKKLPGFGDILVLAVKGTVAGVTRQNRWLLCWPAKTVIDATNPIADTAPENGVMKFMTDLNRSLMEKLQALAPSANFVKAFSCVGEPFDGEPEFAGGVNPPCLLQETVRRHEKK
jgi:hypothetical protein